MFSALEITHKFCESDFEKVFKKVDRDQEGALSRVEVIELLGELIKEPKKRTVRIIKRRVQPRKYQLDLDGRIVKVEES